MNTRNSSFAGKYFDGSFDVWPNQTRFIYIADAQLFYNSSVQEFITTLLNGQSQTATVCVKVILHIAVLLRLFIGSKLRCYMLYIVGKLSLQQNYRITFCKFVKSTNSHEISVTKSG